MIKKRIVIFMIMCMALMLGGCGGDTDSHTQPGEPVSVILDYQDVKIEKDNAQNKTLTVSTETGRPASFIKPTNDVYRFGGWYTDIGGGGKELKPTDTVTKDLDGKTLYAFWQGSEGLEYEFGGVKKGTLSSSEKNVVIAPYFGGIKTTIIGVDAFRDMSNMETIHMPESITRISNNAFYRSGLKSIEIPQAVDYIGMQAFYGCANLAEIELPQAVTSVGYSAFYGCESLKFVKINSMITDSTTLSFNHTSILLVPDNMLNSYRQKFGGSASGDGAYGIIHGHSAMSFEFILSGEKLVKYIGTSTELTIPSSITQIAENAFYGNHELTKIILHSNVANVDNYAFANSSAQIVVPFASNNVPSQWGEKWCFDTETNMVHIIYS